MCLSSHADAIIKLLTDLKKAKAVLAALHAPNLAAPGDLDLTVEEAQFIMERRIGGLEAACRELGCHGPAPKADPGESQFITNKR